MCTKITPINPERMVQDLDEWEKLIGKFMIACGTIEKCTYELLQILPTEDLSRVVLKMGFIARIELACDLLPQRIADEKLVGNLIEKFQQVKDKISLRNTIAHNPVDLSLYIEGSTVKPKQVLSKFHHEIDKMRKSEVDVFEMEERCTEMEFLASDIYQLQMSVEAVLWVGT